MSTQMPTYEEMYSFLKTHYRDSRFEGKEKSNPFHKGKCKRITQMYLDDLEKYGYSIISWHDSSCGRHIRFDKRLIAEYGDTKEKPVNHGNLTHIF